MMSYTLKYNIKQNIDTNILTGKAFLTEFGQK